MERPTPTTSTSPSRPTRTRAPRAAPPHGERASTDPRETPIAKRELHALVERFTQTIEHPVEQAIAPHAIHALVAFAAIHRKPTRTITLGWIDPRLVIEGTPIDDEHPAGLAACYFAVLAAFFRFRADEGALDREAAARLAATYVQAAAALAQLEVEERGPRS